MPEAEVLVIGAGPAGAAAACELARLGRRVLMIDPAAAGTARVETLPERGERLARAMGLTTALEAATLGRADQTRMFWRHAPETVDHAGGGPLLLDRLRFSQALRLEATRRGAGFLNGRVRRVRSLKRGVEVVVDGVVLRAQVAIDARGRAGRRGGHESALTALPFHGRLAAAEAPELILEALAEGWLWAAHATGGVVAGAIFLPAQRLSGGGSVGRWDLAVARLAEASLLRGMGLRGIGRPQAAAQIAADDPVAEPRVLRIGDRALAQDPIASQGVTQALRSASHAAAAANSIVTAMDDRDAAYAFLRERHLTAWQVAERARARVYAEQSRWRNAAWPGPAATGDPAPIPELRTPTSRPLALAPELRRAAVLTDGRIGWAEVLTLPATGRSAAYFGSISAAQLAGLLLEPAPLATLSARLARVAAPEAVHRILTTLLAEGALVPVGAGQGDAGRS